MAATTISDLARPSLAKGVRLQIDSTTGKNVLLYPEGIVELNETAHEILSRCDGRTLGEIIRELAKEYEADSAALAADVRETLADLRQRKLINSHERTPRFAKASGVRHVLVSLSRYRQAGGKDARTHRTPKASRDNVNNDLMTVPRPYALLRRSRTDVHCIARIAQILSL